MKTIPRWVPMRPSTQKANDPWFMAGTEKTGEYLVVLCGKYGRLGVRELPEGWRVRIEPSNQKSAEKLHAFFSEEEGWKQPGDTGQFRFSAVFSKAHWSKEEIERLILQDWLLQLQGVWPCQLNPAVAESSKHLSN